MNTAIASPAWTESAERLLLRWFLQRLSEDRLAGADADEVRSDLRAHLHADLAAAGVKIVTEDALRQALVRMGEPLPEEIPERPPFRAAFMPRTLAERRPVPRGWTATTVILPLLALGFEVATGMCRSMLFDPIPDLWHWLLILVVPVCGCLLPGALRQRPGNPVRAVKWRVGLLGAALVAAGWYALLLLPFTVQAAVMVLYLGAGLAPLSPLLACIVLFAAWKRLREKPAEAWGGKPGRYLRRGALAALLVILVSDGHSLLTRIVAHCYHRAESPATQAGWVKFLRAAGSRNTLLRLCYEPDGFSIQASRGRADPAGFIAGIVKLRNGNQIEPRGSDRTEQDASGSRGLYYRVTGQLFSALPPPPSRETGLMLPRRVDSARGGREVAGQIDGLSLKTLRMDWHVESASGLAWGEYTLVFANASQSAEEARCRIALPEDGCVSRVVLWVNGEPQEAAYAGAADVRRAYQKVAVVERRDPVLVTQPDPAGIMLQAFPVPAGGTMKMRLTFTAPVRPDGKVWLPAIGERNFAVDSGLTAQFWAQTDGAQLLPPSPLDAAAVSDGGYLTLSGPLPAPGLLGKGSCFICPVKPAASVWTSDPFNNNVLVRRPAAGAAAAHDAVAVVIDSSHAAGPHAEAAAAALGSIPAAALRGVMLPEDINSSKLGADSRAAAAALRKASFNGGRDNTDALAAAFESVRGAKHPLVLWLHGPQPSIAADTVRLQQLSERGALRGTLAEISLSAGENALLSVLASCPQIQTRSLRWDGTDAHLGALFAEAAAGTPPSAGWESLPAGTEPPADAVKVSDTLARRRGLEQFRTLMAQNDPAGAVAVASAARLVTARTGAVVLERAADYKANGLTQTDTTAAQQIPVVPEPSSSLLILGSGMLMLMRRRRKG